MTTCDFCAHTCRLAPGQRGRCGVRENRNGAVVTLHYGRLCALALDPVEKKPLYHFLPGTLTLSLALHGCNFSCPFCQNYSISQKEFFEPTAGDVVGPEEVVRIARERRIPSISFTYSEPTVWQDYLLATAHLARAAGIRTIMVTNGYFSKPALERLAPAVDAFNIDLKGSDHFYRTYCGARQEPVLDAIEHLAARPETVLEVTTLVIEETHSDEEILALGAALVSRGVKVWHLSAYHPAYRLSNRPTDPERLASLFERIRRELPLPHIYLGNVGGDRGHDTVCTACGGRLITRRGFSASLHAFDHGRCRACGAPLYGRFEEV